MNNKINIEELSKIKEKSRIHLKEEELNFESIKEVLEEINYNYDTPNKTKLEKLETDLINKLNIITINHQNNITIIEKNISTYQKTMTDTEKIFNNIIE